MKNVVVFSTQGQAGVSVQTEATTWKGLQADLDKQGVKYSGMKAVDGGSKATLENPDALLPEGDMQLFLFPTKTKSGATGFTQKFVDGLSHSELRSTIKELILKDESAKDHFNSGGKSYTNKSTPDMRELLVAYKPSKGSKKTTAKADAPKASTKAVAKTKATKEPAAKASSKASSKAPAKAATTKAVSKAKSEEKPAKATTKAVAKKSTGSKSKIADIASEVAEEQVMQVSTETSVAVKQIANLISGLTGVNKADKDAAIKSVIRLDVTKGLQSGAPKEIVIDNKKLLAEARAIGKGIPGIVQP